MEKQNYALLTYYPETSFRATTDAATPNASSLSSEATIRVARLSAQSSSSTPASDPLFEEDAAESGSNNRLASRAKTVCSNALYELYARVKSVKDSIGGAAASDRGQSVDQCAHLTSRLLKVA